MEARSGGQGAYTFSWRRWMASANVQIRRQPLVPSFRVLDCPNFIGNSGWLYRQFFTTDYITVLKVHWLTITWYSSYTSCFKIFVLTKFSGENLGTIRYNTSCFKISILTKLSEYFEEAIDARIWHLQTLFVDWCLSSKRYGRETV